MQRPLLLNGFMASGKSTVAAVVGRRTARAVVDLDKRIEAQTGKSIAEIFAHEGESRFRQLEREALEHVLDEGEPVVVALGGGTLLRRSMRLLALERAVVVSLRASAQTVLERVGDSSARPLLRGKDASDVEELMSMRATAYAEAHELIDVDGQSVEAIAERVVDAWRRDPVAVAAGFSSYSVEVGQDFAPERVAEVVGDAPKVFVLTDATVGGLYGHRYLDALKARGIDASVFSQPPGEEFKTPASLEKIWIHCLEAEADRRSCFVGLGGGVMTDVAGFAAATWMRGVDWVSVPTTLLGMVDASVGGKTAVDLPGAKNCVGAFWQPRRVLCDVGHLRTEPGRGLRSALAEVVKTALIGDPEMFELLERRSAEIVDRDWGLIAELVRRCIVVKARVVSQDEREGGVRAALNLGHTVGHALEAYGGFGGLSHGEAVSLGLVAAMKLGQRLGVTQAALAERVQRLLSALGLPADLGTQPVAQAAQLLGHDKKRGGNQVRFVLCAEPGEIEFRKLEIPELVTLVSALG